MENTGIRIRNASSSYVQGESDLFEIDNNLPYKNVKLNNYASCKRLNIKRKKFLVNLKKSSTYVTKYPVTYNLKIDSTFSEFLFKHLLAVDYEYI